MNPTQAVSALLRASPDALVVASLGTATSALRAASGDGPHLYMGGAMGSALAAAVGVAGKRPERSVVALLGDGETLMGAGSLWSLAGIRPANLLAVVLADGHYTITGGQPLGVPGAFAEVAGRSACRRKSRIPRPGSSAARASFRCPALLEIRYDERTWPGPSPFVDPPVVRFRFEAAASAMILVTGATGQVGRAVIGQLAGATPVRALVRDRAAAADLGSVEIACRELRGRGVACAGVGRGRDRVPGRPRQPRAGGAARPRDPRRERPPACVTSSSSRRIGASPTSPVALMRWHAAIEEQLRDSSLRWTFLRPHLYMQNLLRFAGDVAGGRLAAPMGAPPVSVRRRARRRPGGGGGAARARGHSDCAYALTGPRAVGYAELAGLIGDMIGRSVAYHAVAPERFHADLLAAGVPMWRADDLAAIADAYTDAENAPSSDLESSRAGRRRRSRRFLPTTARSSSRATRGAML